MKWEYKVILDPGLPTGPLNDEGEEGWELISVIYFPADGLVRYYFKRPSIDYLYREVKTINLDQIDTVL